MYLKPTHKEILDEDKIKIWHLYFDKLLDREEIMAKFNGKYDRFDIARVINEKYK